MRGNESNVTVLSENPFNAESDLTELIKHPITPMSLVYSRNHGTTKDFAQEDSSGLDTYRLSIQSEVDEISIDSLNKSFSLKDLLVYFPCQNVTAVMSCAGNRRAKMVEKTGHDVEGLKWGEGTIANIRWGGVSLRKLLLRVGVPAQAQYDDLHVCFSSHSSVCEEDSYFGASIPLNRAMDEEVDVLLAYQMNDEPLSAQHGFPLRVVVPGYTATRWVKWLDHITISRHESPNFYQQRDYKVLPETVTSHRQADSEDWWSRIPPMQTIALNSVVAKVDHISGDTDKVTVKAVGYALSHVPVDRVEISGNAGKTWVPATVTYQEGRWSWALWEGEVDVAIQTLKGGNKCATVLSQAYDGTSAKQGTKFAWNLRGIGFNGVGEASTDL
ncbi:Oxidoreductase, molybdopterin-binding domain-containing protein [Hygrophoropsis aurantiaca]|uniref:Oxidoreductase, molybdopterin-binding domain-containing protein n=1 Tax=Hygrophoropsis aurantiaca TaxID=72124 RepID=A0ACB8AIK8_9AGAM|nr:Oxidoreductase, molybdopterin-binding domain-containing protein [Hygrophoropsis aurantiaca]